MKLPVKHPKLKPSTQPELRELANRVGEFISYWGFKTVQGRLWCYLYLSKQPLSSVELADLLEVSPALVTQSVQVLLEYRVILPAPKGKNGILRYEANPNAAEAVRQVLSMREARLLESVCESAASLSRAGAMKKAGAPVEIDPERLAQVREWIGLAQALLSGALELLASPDNPFQKPSSYKRVVISRR